MNRIDLAGGGEQLQHPDILFQQNVAKETHSEEIRCGEDCSVPLEAFNNPYFIVMLAVALWLTFRLGRMLIKAKFNIKRKRQ